MAKLDPNNPIIKVMLIIIVVYMICNVLLVNVYEKDYDHNLIKDKIIQSKTKQELKENVEIVHKNTKLRFYLLLTTCGILFILYVIFKYRTNKSEGVALCALVILGLTGKLIEKIGLANCLTIPFIDPKLNPAMSYYLICHLQISLLILSTLFMLLHSFRLVVQVLKLSSIIMNLLNY